MTKKPLVKKASPQKKVLGSTAALDALAQMSRRQPFGDAEYKAYWDEIHADKNQRGAALLLAANVENELRTAIQSCLTVINDKELFDFGSPLGTFEYKIRMATALGIIGEKSRSNLFCIKAIRNAFAHARIAMSFKDKEIATVCSMLVYTTATHPLGIISLRLPGAEAKFDKLSGLDRYRTACNHLTGNLFGFAVLALDGPTSRTDGHFQNLARPTSLQ